MEPVPADKCHVWGNFKVLNSVTSSRGDSSSSTSWVRHQKWKRRVVAAHELVEIDDNDDDSTMIDEAASNDKQEQVVGDFADDFVSSSTSCASGADKTLERSNSTFVMDDNDDDVLEDFGFEIEDDYDAYVFEEDIGDNDYDYNLAAKFDDLDLPPGVEATVPWLQKLTTDMTSMENNAVNAVESNDKLSKFKQFDVTQDYSDHYFVNPENIEEISVAKKPSKDWIKRIQHEWKILEKDLPETIFVRTYEERMDLLRAVIIGPAGTPYHDGLFFFDCFLPSSYPGTPPLVHYHSRGLRLNPNLYACGKVCLSLLGTWSGDGCEMWSPGTSTMLQVLVSIQALVLNAKPYFNEPGYETSANTGFGEQKALTYNEDIFLLSCKTMMHSLQRPPKNFEDFVAGHFCRNGHTILLACKAYISGSRVGCPVTDDVLDLHADKEGEKNSPSQFRSRLKKLFEELLMEFTVKGADCDVFLRQKLKAGQAKAKTISAPSSDTTFRL